MNAMTVVNKVGLKLKKHSPEILVGVGIVGVVVSGVLACKATLKVEGIIAEHNENMDKIRKCPESEKYTETDRKHDTAIQYGHTVMKLSKLYAPAVGLAVISLGSIIGSNYILRKRNAAITAAYASIYTAFNEYRERVVERFGKDVDHQLRYNIKQTEIEETVTDEKTGKEKQVKKKVNAALGDESGYARYLRSGNGLYYGGNNDYIRMALNAKQAMFNTWLQAKGYLTLNEAYRELGFEESKAGMVCGWIYDPDRPNGDNYIQLDVTEVYLPTESGDYEKAFAIDFNVDGNIFENLTEELEHK